MDCVCLIKEGRMHMKRYYQMEVQYEAYTLLGWWADSEEEAHAAAKEIVEFMAERGLIRVTRVGTFKIDSTEIDAESDPAEHITEY